MTRQPHLQSSGNRTADVLAAAVQAASAAIARNAPRRRGDSVSNALMPLENRRLMSGDTWNAGLVELRDQTLWVDADPHAAATMAVELDADASHIRGVLTGVDGHRIDGQWYRVDAVRQIKVAGGEDYDKVELDSRLLGSATISVGADVEKVTIVYDDDGDANKLRREKTRSARLAQQVGRSNATSLVELKKTDLVRPDITDTRGDAGPVVETIRLVNLNLRPDDSSNFPALTDGATLQLSDLDNVGLLAELASDLQFDGSVHVRLVGPDGTYERVENLAPYAIFGDTNGLPNPFTAKPGEYTLEVTAYTGRAMTGTEGQTLKLSFKVVDAGPIIVDEPAEPATPVPAPTPTPEPAPTPEPTPAPPANANQPGSPEARISAITSSIWAGQSVHVSALDTTLHNGHWNDASFVWNFGDASGAHNEYRGFVAAHIYDQPGEYTVTLTVTDEAGKVGTKTLTVNVMAASRRTIYVDAQAGNDQSDGSSPNGAVRSVERAKALMEQHGDHVRILFRRGQTHSLDSGIEITADDVTIGAYGTGAKPVLSWTGEKTDRNSIITTHGQAEQVMIRDLTFTNANVTHNGKGLANAVRPAGKGIAVVNNTFLNVDNGVSGNMNPEGLLVQGNSAPSRSGIRGYFVWGQGKQLSIVGNSAVNSTREHIVRVAFDIEGVTVSGNNFANVDRREASDRDAGDIAKGVIVIQHGSFGYVSDNIISGPSGVGPLGDADGLPSAAARFTWAVWEHNTHLEGSQMTFEHGMSHVDFRYNVIRNDGAHMIAVEGYNGDYGRTVHDLTIHGNLGVNMGETGNFLWAWAGAERIEVTDNTYVAPNLDVGPYHSVAMLVKANNLDSFTTVDGNTWPAPASGGWAQGGMIFVGIEYDQPGFRDAAEWNAMPGVGTDTFIDANADAVYSMMLSQFGMADHHRAIAA